MQFKQLLEASKWWHENDPESRCETWDIACTIMVQRIEELRTCDCDAFHKVCQEYEQFRRRGYWFSKISTRAERVCGDFKRVHFVLSVIWLSFVCFSSVCLSVCLPVCLSVCLPVCLSVCQSVRTVVEGRILQFLLSPPSYIHIFFFLTS